MSEVAASKSEGQVRVVVALLMLAGTACGRSTTVVRTVDTYHPRTWVGASVSAIEVVWGPAKAGESDGLGGRIISYRGAPSNVSMTAQGSLPDPGDDSDAQGKPDRDLLAEARAPQDANDAQVDAKFWVDSTGKVYRYWFSERVWNKSPEKTAPPGKAPGAKE